jgi:hypothetical protein
MLGHAARFEVEQKGARQAAANLQRARMGDVRWTRRPYGYDRADGQVVQVDAEVAELRAAAEAVLAGATLASIVAELNQRQVTTSTGAPWSVTTLKRLLVNPRHAGRAVYRGQDVAGGGWPAILSAETHEQLVALLSDPRRRTAPASTAAKYLLSGIAACGVCGQPVYASPMGPRGSRWMVYRCRTPHLTRRLDLVDEVVEEVVLDRLTQPDVLTLLSPTEDVSALAAQASAVRERLDGLAELLADGTLPKAAVRVASSRLRRRLDELTARIASATSGDALAPLVSAGDVRSHWRTMALRSRRTVVDALVGVTLLPSGKGVRFDPAQVRIEWRTP